jgi:hypothetical protein
MRYIMKYNITDINICVEEKKAPWTHVIISSEGILKQAEKTTSNCTVPKLNWNI